MEVRVSLHVTSKAAHKLMRTAHKRVRKGQKSSLEAVEKLISVDSDSDGVEGGRG
jgi:hypothetical protein